MHLNCLPQVQSVVRRVSSISISLFIFLVHSAIGLGHRHIICCREKRLCPGFRRGQLERKLRKRLQKRSKEEAVRLNLSLSHLVLLTMPSPDHWCHTRRPWC